MRSFMLYHHRMPGLFRYATYFVLLQVFDLLTCDSLVWADEAIRSRRVGVSDWQFDPALIMNVALIGWLYTRGIARLRGSSQRRVSFGQVNILAFVFGLAILVGCLLSPLDLLSAQLASAHMVQHMTIMTIAAPLVALGSPGLLLGLGLPPIGRSALRHVRQSVRCVIGRPDKRLVGCWIIYALAMWVWHYPMFYESALRSPLVHDLQHLSFFLAALLFWQPIVDPFFRPKQNRGAAVFYLFTTTLHATILGVFMTVAPSAWYPHYEGLSQLWNLSPLEDQQLAGLIMWMPACAAYAFCAIAIFSAAISHDHQRSGQFAILVSGRS
jgi:putative membrane protein